MKLYLLSIASLLATITLMAAEPAKRSDAVEKQLAKARDNRPELEKALDGVPADQRKGMEFLVANMPDSDLATLKADFLKSNCELAYRARKELPWGKDIPESLFFNNVLPYANVDEKRDEWRKEFFDLCVPLVKDCKTATEAAVKLNSELFKKLGVKYAPQKRSPNLSPKEAIAQGHASCTGLSIVLSDACRAVGIPTRLVGTPNWSDKRGNHTWIEIWDGDWHFTGACEQDPKGLDRGWFVGDAAKAQQDVPEHAIYAASFGKTGTHYPLVWAKGDKSVNGENVTGRYAKKDAKKAETVRLSIRVIDDRKKRVAVPVTVTGDSGAMLEGKSRAERRTPFRRTTSVSSFPPCIAPSGCDDAHPSSSLGMAVMIQLQRREFLADVGRGMLVAGLSSGLAVDLGLAPAMAEELPKRLTFDKLEPLVAIMQETPLDKLLPALLAKHRDGTDLRTLTAAGALANARTFGGQDYTGYHAFMALPPAFEMAAELPEERRALPVLKVLYRNAQRIQAVGGSKSEVLHPVPQGEDGKAVVNAETLRSAARKPDMELAEKQFDRLMTRGTAEAFDALQYTLQDEIDVHRVVLCWRAWTMIDISGKEYAGTLLRQSVRYCVDSEQKRLGRKGAPSGIRELLPKLLDEHKLAGKTPGTKKPDDPWVEKLAETIYGGGKDRAAEAVAMALAEGFSIEAVGEAMSLASTFLVLRDPGRTRDEEGKPKGSVHGASVGVHASDSANAWRGIARVSPSRNAFASLIVGAYHTAGQSGGQTKESLPHADALSKVTAKDAAKLLELTDAAIRSKDQALASALAHRYGEAGHPEKALFELLLTYAISEDGALHAEKYYRTVREEYARSRSAFRGRHLTALARVTASEFGYPAPGFDEAKKLLKV